MILNVYKEPNMTSRDVVNIIGKHFNTKKVGHTGTLDPLASGVLLICTEKDTKLVDILTSKTKEYIATIKLGIKTDTGDITGNIIDTKSFQVTEEQIINTLNLFLGFSIQTVPIYSAVKINGKKLYEYARNNEKVELPKREIEVKEIQLLKFVNDEISFKVLVSKGTYIRSLIEDICEKLNTVGTMKDLVRTKQGNYCIEDSNKIDDIKNNKYTSLSLKEIFKEYEEIKLNDNDYFKVKNGSKMSLNSKNDIVLLTYNDEPIALYKKDNDIYRVYIMLKNN